MPGVETSAIGAKAGRAGCPPVSAALAAESASSVIVPLIALKAGEAWISLTSSKPTSVA